MTFSPASYPDAPRLDLVEMLPADAPTHEVADPYRWLEETDSPQSRSWAEAQYALANSHLANLPGRDQLRTRLKELLGAGTIGPPSWRGERQFFMRRNPDQEHSVLLTIDPDGTERVLLDPMVVDSTGMTTLDAWQPSKEGDLLAYQLSEGGSEESVLRVIDVGSGALVDGPIDRARYSPVAWLPGGKAYYYVRRLPAEEVPAGEEQFHRRVWLHQVGTDPAEDTLVFGSDLKATNYYSASVTMDGRWLTITATEGTSPRNDVWIADLTASDPTAPDLRVVQLDVDAFTSVHMGRDGRGYTYTDRDARRGRVVLVDPAEPAYDNWRDLVPEDPEAVLEAYLVLDGPGFEHAGQEPVLLCVWTRHAVSEITVHDLATGKRREGEAGTIALPGLGSVGSIIERPEGGHEAWFSYGDHVSPSSVYHYDALADGGRGETKLWSRSPGSVDVPEISAQQVTYTSTDGTEVRMFVLSPPLPESGQPEAPRPAILYGYGGFGIPMTPGYSSSILTWVEAGGVYVVANLRGGSEEGEDWHRDGMLDRKQNTFDDFHSAAERLIADGWTTPEQLSIQGGSNGGLLVGAAMTQRPELYASVVCSAPLLDMVRYEQFGLGATWNVEYGTAADPEQLGWLHAYSPYHRVREGVEYPATLFTVFEGDTRVDPLHAAKMCAALQHGTTSERPILLRSEKDVGHGARAISRTVELSVDTIAFTAYWTGLKL